MDEMILMEESNYINWLNFMQELFEMNFDGCKTMFFLGIF
jgi:hypothetical protein